jgi:hypothetical protein
LKWSFYAANENTKVIWKFQAETKEAIATFATCKTLQVLIEKTKMTEADSALITSSPYVMRQELKVKNIGKEFLDKAVTMFAVFWDLDELSLLSTLGRKRVSGGDFIGPVCKQPFLFGGQFGNLRPKAGIYVRGIYIRPSKIKDAIMYFYSDRLEVTGRDRNEVDDSSLVDAVIHVFKNCSNMKYLKKLFAPLQLGMSNSGGDSSWLLKSQGFINRILEQERDFILYRVMNFSVGSIFISSKTTQSKDPFLSWASKFLKEHEMPLVPIEKGANKILFQEADEYTLTEQCVQLIKNKQKRRTKIKKGPSSNSFFAHFLSFLSIRGCKIILSEEVQLAFIHDSDIFIPESRLSREMIIRVLNVCHSRVDGVPAENYSALLEAVIKVMKPGENSDLSTDHAKQIVNEAKRIKKKSSEFFLNQATSGEDNSGDDYKQRRSTSCCSGSQNTENHDSSTQTLHNRKPPSNDFLDGLIQKAIKNASSAPERAGGGAFALDQAGPNDCIRPSSQMQAIQVGIDYGEDSILCDEDTAKAIQSNNFNGTAMTKIKNLRHYLREAIKLIKNSIPILSPLLETVHHGYDANNDTYEAFFDGNQIVVNLFAFKDVTLNRRLTHTFVTVITHELAHALRPQDGHGPEWRNCHMNMIVKIMEHLDD